MNGDMPMTGAASCHTFEAIFQLCSTISAGNAKGHISSNRRKSAVVLAFTVSNQINLQHVSLYRNIACVRNNLDPLWLMYVAEAGGKGAQRCWFVKKQGHAGVQVRGMML